MNKLNHVETPTDAEIVMAVARGRVLRSQAMTGAIARLATAPARWLGKLGQVGHAGECPARTS